MKPEGFIAQKTFCPCFQDLHRYLGKMPHAFLLPRPLLRLGELPGVAQVVPVVFGSWSRHSPCWLQQLLVQLFNLLSSLPHSVQKIGIVYG